MLDDAEIDRRLVAGLAARTLEEKFWYASDAAAEAWLALCRSAGYRNYDRAGRTVAAAAPEIAAGFEGSVEIVGLGAGDAAKELAIADALAKASAAPSLVAVDVSRRLLEVAIAQAAGRGIPARAIRADLGDPAHLAALEERGGAPRIWALLGNSVGALDRARMLSSLGRLVRPRDVLLVDGEVFDGATTLGGYDNPDNRRFAWGPLVDLGLGEADGVLDFWLEHGPSGVHAVRKRFTFSRRASVRGFELAPGDSLAMSRSEKYDPGVFVRLVELESGLAARRTWAGDRWTLVEARARE